MIENATYFFTGISASVGSFGGFKFSWRKLGLAG